MHCTKDITSDLIWLGGSDRRLALFENVYPIPRGVSYNAYLLRDEKTALLDTVDSAIADRFFENLEYALQGRELNYVIVNHMEPDHAATLGAALGRHPEAVVIGNAKTLGMIRQFFPMELEGRFQTVREGDTLSLGKHELTFVMAPLVHWPEVMMTYESSEKLLFSADAFGSFGATGGNLFNDELNFDRDWLDDARRYYGNIVGKYGLQVQAALKKLSGLDIAMICPLHGPIWRSNLDYLLDKYDKWSRYEPEERAVAVLYASMYGDTENAVNLLAAGLADGGVKNIAMHDISSTHVSTLISEVFRCSHLVLAAPTYNNGVYPAMATFLHDMKALGLQNRTVALVENGSWAPVSGKLMREMLGELKGFQVLEPVVSLKSALKDSSLEPLFQLRDRILDSLNG